MGWFATLFQEIGELDVASRRTPKPKQHTYTGRFTRYWRTNTGQSAILYPTVAHVIHSISRIVELQQLLPDLSDQVRICCECAGNPYE